MSCCLSQQEGIWPQGLDTVLIKPYCCSVAKSNQTSRDPMTAAHQASLSFTMSQSLLKLMSLEFTQAAAAAAAKSLQSCPTLCDPTDSSPPGSTVPGILQARTLEWVAISFSNA